MSSLEIIVDDNLTVDELRSSLPSFVTYGRFHG
jgi:hypothetical protein